MNYTIIIHVLLELVVVVSVILYSNKKYSELKQEFDELKKDYLSFRSYTLNYVDWSYKKLSPFDKENGISGRNEEIKRGENKENKEDNEDDLHEELNELNKELAESSILNPSDKTDNMISDSNESTATNEVVKKSVKFSDNVSNMETDKDNKVESTTIIQQ